VEHESLGYRQVMFEGVGLVPFMVLETGRDLSRLQRTGDSARDGHLTLLDAVTWVHASLNLVRDGSS
jgi:hypothetical protein